MIVLGLNHGELQSSAAICRDGKIIAGAAEERFNRLKRYKDFPKQAVDFCLKFAGKELKACDYIAQAWNPGASWQKYNPLLSKSRIKREDNFYAIPDNLLNLTERKPLDWVLMEFPGGWSLPSVYHVQHHRAHAAAAFFLSPFEEAAILTCDWRGEYETTTLGNGRGNKIDMFSAQSMPDSLGAFYGAYTELLGYRADNDEWKVMALSAFDVNCKKFMKKIRSTVRFLDDGKFELDQAYYKGALLDQPKLYTDRLVSLLGGREGSSDRAPEEWDLCVARAMQLVFEEITTHILKYLHERTKQSNLVLGGGSFMNCVYNGKIVDQTPFKKVFINYAPADLGNSLGAALYVSHCLLNEKRDLSFSSSYLGPSFTDAQVEAALIRRKVRYEKHDRIERKIAELLSQGGIVAVFNGRMEFGERALGNRSILADPRDGKMKDRINAMIKYRENYRPFAPVVDAKKAHVYFDVAKGYESNYMEKVALVRKAYRDKFPAITHVDGSARVQTVTEQINPFLHGVVSEFEKKTACPAVLNTSLNINGEPIALSPDDALNTFYNSGLEYLAAGSFLVTK